MYIGNVHWSDYAFAATLMILALLALYLLPRVLRFLARIAGSVAGAFISETKAETKRPRL